MRKLKITKGQKFNRLTVIKEVTPRIRLSGTKFRRAIFICDCGKKTEVDYYDAKRGRTKSCGCLAQEIRYNNKNGLTHGMTKTRFYQIYKGIIARCNNKEDTGYYLYGARGIKCDWKDFFTFKRDMYKSYIKHSEKHSEKDTKIDRIDNNKNYCKKNCRWATQREQSNNRRNNRVLTYKGKTMTMAEWSREIGLKHVTLSSRINTLKWSIKDAIEKPLNNN